MIDRVLVPTLLLVSPPSHPFVFVFVYEFEFESESEFDTVTVESSCAVLLLRCNLLTDLSVLYAIYSSIYVRFLRVF